MEEHQTAQPVLGGCSHSEIMHMHAHMTEKCVTKYSLKRTPVCARTAESRQQNVFSDLSWGGALSLLSTATKSCKGAPSINSALETDLSKYTISKCINHE